MNETIAHVFGVDHALVHATASLLHLLPRARRAASTKCGKWSVDVARAVEACEKRANEGPRHVWVLEFEALCRSVTFRPASFRYVDPPDVKARARERKRAPEDQRQALAKQVASLRRQHKQEWLADVLLQARSGNYRATSYMRRRQSVGHVHLSYILCAGGEQQAIADLKHFYASEYAEDQDGDNLISMRMVAQHVGDVNAVPFSLDEVKQCLASFKQGKSAGEDGIP